MQNFLFLSLISLTLFAKYPCEDGGLLVTNVGFENFENEYVCPLKPACLYQKLCPPVKPKPDGFCSDGILITNTGYDFYETGVCLKGSGCYSKERCKPIALTNEPFCENGLRIQNTGYYEIGDGYVCPKGRGCYLKENCE